MNTAILAMLIAAIACGIGAAVLDHHASMESGSFIGVILLAIAAVALFIACVVLSIVHLWLH